MRTMGNPSKVRVLVAEDEPAMLSLNANFLRQRGFDVTEASDGERAWTLAQTGRFDLVLLDVMMPGMSGWEVCKRIKSTPSSRDTAVCMLTGIGETMNDMTSPLFSADAWLNKPFDFGELLRKLREALAKHGKAFPDDTAHVTLAGPKKARPRASEPTAPKAADTATKKPAAKPAPAKPAAKKPAAAKPATAKPATKKPAANKLAAAPKKAAGKPASNKPVAKKAVSKKPVSKKPVAKKAAPKKGKPSKKKK